jgi:hypothetical protein
MHDTNAEVGPENLSGSEKTPKVGFNVQLFGVSSLAFCQMRVLLLNILPERRTTEGSGALCGRCGCFDVLNHIQ